MEENGLKGNLSMSLSHFLLMELSEQVKVVCKEGDAERRDDTRKQWKETMQIGLCTLGSKAVLKTTFT